MKNIFSKIRFLYSSRVNKEYNLGYNSGYEVGKKEGMNLMSTAEYSDSISKQDYENLIKYLNDNRILITYTQNHSPYNFTCGLVIRKKH